MARDRQGGEGAGLDGWKAARGGGRLGSSARLAATLGSAAVILLLALVTHASIQRSRAVTAWVRHTDRATLLIDRTLADLTDAETGQRGCLLTGNPMLREREAREARYPPAWSGSSWRAGLPGE